MPGVPAPHCPGTHLPDSSPAWEADPAGRTRPTSSLPCTVHPAASDTETEKGRGMNPQAGMGSTPGMQVAPLQGRPLWARQGPPDHPALSTAWRPHQEGHAHPTEEETEAVGSSKGSGASPWGRPGMDLAPHLTLS